MKFAIVITLCRRPKYTRQLFDALRACHHFEQFPVYISCDFDERHREDCLHVWAMTNEFAREIMKDGKQNCFIFQNIPRLGIDLNKLFIIPQALSHSGADGFIFLEDDTIPAPDALNYFVTNVAKYADDASVVAVCGYRRITDAANFLENQANRYYFTMSSTGFNPWGWATTKAKWEALFGDDGKQYKKDTGSEANGRFDWWILGKGNTIIQPSVARVQSVGGEGGEHTVSPEWHFANEYNPYGAWSAPCPIQPLFSWGNETV